MIKKLTCLALIFFCIAVLTVLVIYDYASKNIIGGRDLPSLLLSIKAVLSSAAGLFLELVVLVCLIVLKLSKKRPHNEENDDDIFS
ncbi:MAG: hypothetical protein IJ740_15265 [Ruminococcus sp.]|nr:hypothetical protein [Ruminococcus sp.]